MLFNLTYYIKVYNVNFAARISAEIDIPAMRRAFQALVDRHPALRTTFPVSFGKPIQHCLSCSIGIDACGFE